MSHELRKRGTDYLLGPNARAAGTKLFVFDTTTSTNINAKEYGQTGEQGPAWFVAREQTAGYGRRGRAWVAPRGNLAASVLVTLDVQPAVAATLGFVAGVAVQQALRSLSRESAARGVAAIDFALKWPNDVLANGHKLVGIGLEAHAMPASLAVVVGIGVNNIAAPEDTPFPATSLTAEGLQLSAEDVFTTLSDTWTDLFALWDNGRNFADIRKLWLASAYNLGGTVSVQLGERIVEGTFEAIDETGCMIVATPQGRMPVTAGDVYFGTARSARVG